MFYLSSVTQLLVKLSLCAGKAFWCTAAIRAASCHQNCTAEGSFCSHWCVYMHLLLKCITYKTIVPFTWKKKKKKKCSPSIVTLSGKIVKKMYSKSFSLGYGRFSLVFFVRNKTVLQRCFQKDETKRTSLQVWLKRNTFSSDFDAFFFVCQFIFNDKQYIIPCAKI